jgi:hypothetical protein
MKVAAAGPERSEMTITFTGAPVRATVVVVFAAGLDGDAAVPLELLPLQPAAERLATTAIAAVRSNVWRMGPPCRAGL